MDRFSVLSVQYASSWHVRKQRVDVTEFFVNGRNLLAIIAESNSEAGVDVQEYVGIDSADAFLPSSHLMGKPLYSKHGMALLYRCAGCGLPDCASIEVRISVQEDVVVWDRFRVDSIDAVDDPVDDPAEGNGRYLDLPAFQFDRKDYQNALQYHEAKRIPGTEG